MANRSWRAQQDPPRIWYARKGWFMVRIKPHGSGRVGYGWPRTYLWETEKPLDPIRPDPWYFIRDFLARPAGLFSRDDGCDWSTSKLMLHTLLCWMANKKTNKIASDSSRTSGFQSPQPKKIYSYSSYLAVDLPQVFIVWTWSQWFWFRFGFVLPTLRGCPLLVSVDTLLVRWIIFSGILDQSQKFRFHLFQKVASLFFF